MKWWNFHKQMLLYLLLFVLPGCANKKDLLTLQVTETFTINAIPSGSGIVVYKDAVLIAGDDADYIIKINMDDHQIKKIPLYHNALLTKVDKFLKHDLESCTLADFENKTFLFAFGSGGISPYRDTLFGVKVNDETKNFKISLLPLYEAICIKAGVQKKQLNIEGAALSGDRLLLFNRAINFIVIMQWSDMVKYIMNPGKDPLPFFRIVPVSLPVVNNYPVGFSGACTLDENNFLFTASLEETTDFTKDGEVKGSYIGILKVTNDSAVVTKMEKLKDDKGNDILDKLESIDIVKKTGSEIEAIAVADNDDGTSKLFKVKIGY